MALNFRLGVCVSFWCTKRGDRRRRRRSSLTCSTLIRTRRRTRRDTHDLEVRERTNNAPLTLSVHIGGTVAQDNVCRGTLRARWHMIRNG